MIKVLEVFGEPVAHGGQESYLQSQLEHMDLSDMRISILTPYYIDNDSLTRLVKLTGGVVSALELPFRPGKSRHYLEEPLGDYYRKHLDQFDIAHIHSGSTSFLAFAARSARDNGVKTIIVHSHATSGKSKVLTTAIRLYSSILMRGCVDCYAACSRDAAIAKFGKKASRAAILRNGIEIEKFTYSNADREAIRSQFGLDQNVVLLGTVGRLAEEKNQKLLITLLAELNARFPSHYALLIVGDGELHEELSRYAKHLKVDKLVIFTGARIDVNRCYSAMDIFLFPSLYEGLGIAAIEAQANGLPSVISTAIPEDADVLIDRIIRANPKSVQSWLDAIISLEGKTVNREIDPIHFSDYDVNTSALALKKMYISVSKKSVVNS